MAFPLGANGKIYNMLVARHPSVPVTITEYNEAVRWINAAQPGSANGQDVPLFTEAPAYTPPATITSPGGGTTGGAIFTGTGAGGTSELMNPQERQNQWALEQQKLIEAGASERAQIVANTNLAAAQAQAAAQLEAQRLADQAALERLRYQLGDSLAAALMENDERMFHRTLDTANLAADPRSIVGFLEFQGRQGGGPTAISQGLAAGMTPSPVWDVIPQTQGLSPELQSIIDLLQGFIGGGTAAGTATAAASPYGRAPVGVGGTKTWQ